MPIPTPRTPRPIAVLLFVLLACAAPVGLAGTVLHLDVQGLVDRAELVIEGRVVSRRCLAGADGRPETEYAVSVDVPHLGGPDGLRVFRFPGGVLPDTGTGMVVPGLPDLAVGEEVVLFLTAESGNGWRLPVGLSQGKYRKVADRHGRLLAVRTHGTLELVDPATGAVRRAEPEERADYSRLRGEIERAVQARLEREASRRAEAGEGR